MQYLHRSLDIVKLDQRKHAEAAAFPASIGSGTGLDFDDPERSISNGDRIVKVSQAPARGPFASRKLHGTQR